jgi:hypothetical protein
MNQNPDALRYEGGPIARPFPNALPALLYVSVPEEMENELLLEIAQEFNEEIFAEMEDAFPNYVVSPGVWPKSEARLQRYLLRIYECYPNDPVAREAELYSLLDTMLVDAVKMGLVPPPMSRPWNFLIKMPKVFKHFQADFRDLWYRYMRRHPEVSS